MVNFDVYENLDPQSNKVNPFFLDVQSTLLKDLSTRLVIPLMDSRHIHTPIDRINPCLVINKQKLYLATTQLGSVHVKSLGKKIASVDDDNGNISTAINFVLA